MSMACSFDGPVPVPAAPLSIASSLASPAATCAAASSARFSASLVPTVCSLPKSQDSLSSRVSDRMSSAARTW